MRSVQHELDLARDSADTARRHGEDSSRGAQEELDRWRDRCEGLEDEMRRLEQENAQLRQSADRGPASVRLAWRNEFADSSLRRFQSSRARSTT